MINIGEFTLRPSVTTFVHMRQILVLIFTTVLSALAIIVWSRVNYPSFQDAQYDDSFITYRYAWNLWNGNGFTFNSGEPVNSASSPILVLLLAPLSTVGLEFLPQASQAIGISALALSAGVCDFGIYIT